MCWQPLVTSDPGDAKIADRGSTVAPAGQGKSMQVVCPKCQKRYLVSEDQAGQTARCGNCKTTFVLKAPEPSVPEPGDAQQSGSSTEIPDIAPAGEPSVPQDGEPPPPETGVQIAPPGPDAGRDTPLVGDTKSLSSLLEHE